MNFENLVIAYYWNVKRNTEGECFAFNDSEIIIAMVTIVST